MNNLFWNHRSSLQVYFSCAWGIWCSLILFLTFNKSIITRYFIDEEFYYKRWNLLTMKFREAPFGFVDENVMLYITWHNFKLSLGSEWNLRRRFCKLYANHECQILFSGSCWHNLTHLYWSREICIRFGLFKDGEDEVERNSNKAGFGVVFSYAMLLRTKSELNFLLPNKLEQNLSSLNIKAGWCFLFGFC